jgi:hypothetical protein
MSVQELMEELKKLPPTAQLQDVRLKTSRYEADDLKTVRWQGNHVTLENK